MDLQDFLDKLYQGWSQTTGAENRFWIVEPVEGAGFSIHAVDEHDVREIVATNMTEADADFVAGIHGALADLVRRTSEAVDDAERASLDRDQQEGRIADLELEILGLKQGLESRR